MARTERLGRDIVPEHAADTMAAILNCLIESCRRPTPLASALGKGGARTPA
jgi:hypothetical protein